VEKVAREPLIVDYAIADNCSNPDVVHICHKCNRCGRFPGRPVNMDDMDTSCVMDPVTCNLSDLVDGWSGDQLYLCHCTGGYCLQQETD